MTDESGATRRQFLGAGVMLAALGRNQIVSTEQETLGFSPDDTRVATRDIAFTQSTHVTHPHGRFSVFDTSNPEVGNPEVYARSDPRDGVVRIEPVGRDKEAGIQVATSLEFEPEDAEFFAAVLLELAQKARDGTAWRYP